MAFEQFFYDAELELIIGGESINHQAERVSGGCQLGGKAKIEIGFAVRGGVILGSELNYNFAFNPLNRSNIFTALGIITELPTGGAISGGTITPRIFFDPVTSGGVTLSGHGFSSESRPVSGGILVAGNAFVREKDEEIGSGGIIVGGRAPEEPPISGGAFAGGSAIVAIKIIGESGAVVNGSATITYIGNITPSGGVVINGDARNIENIIPTGGILVGGRSEAAETAFGGILVNGKASTSYDEFGIGGAVSSGKAPNGTHDFGTGGSIAAGSITQRITQHIEVSGVIIGGKAPEEPPTLGGVVLGGRGVQTFNEVAIGGILINGSGIAGIEPGISGGVVVNGSGIAGIEPGISGGILIGGIGAFNVGFIYVGDGTVVIDGEGITEQTDYSYSPTGLVQVTQPDPNIYKLTINSFSFTASSDPILSISGAATVRRRFFGQAIPTFAFGKSPAKNEACRNFREIIRQPTVLAMTRTQTREWLEKLDPEDWSITSFDPTKREVCILVNAGKGITHLITAELLLIDSGVGTP